MKYEFSTLAEAMKGYIDGIYDDFDFCIVNLEENELVELSTLKLEDMEYKEVFLVVKIIRKDKENDKEIINPKQKK